MTGATHITAAMLYDFVQCPHRPAMDLFGAPGDREEVNAFVQLLWEKGNAFEREVIAALKVPFVDLSALSGDEKEEQTMAAMDARAPLIYSGRISSDNLVGEPDILRLEGDEYVAGDIKSGGGEEVFGDERKPKKHYGVQLALYADILQRIGRGKAQRAFVWDVHGEEVTYHLHDAQGVRAVWTVWDLYQDVLAQVCAIVEGRGQTQAAYGGVCKLCHWYSECMNSLEQERDLTLLPELGRVKRDVMSGQFSNIPEFADAEVESYINGKKTDFPGIGPATLRKFHERAKLVSDENGQAYLKAPVRLPESKTELFFDIEVDPMRDFCYLHGFIERHEGDIASERYVAFFTDDTSREEEERAFREAWKYIQEHQPCVVYYYSKYERTIWRELQARFPSVCSAEEIEALFDPACSIDLYYDVVKKATEWPTRDHSIKTLARHLGFDWRDTNPSGAASIEWFDRWIESGDLEIKQRILDYNEDDCLATRVLLDGIRGLACRSAA